MTKSLMIVEDEPTAASELEVCLGGLGYRVLPPVSTAGEALVAAADARPDLVLMDIDSDGDDGLETARRLMTTYRTPVLYLANHCDDETVRRALDTAPFGFVHKPWEEKSLQIAVDLALRASQIEERLRDERDWYLSILRYSGAPMAVCDAEGRVRFMNVAAEHLGGVSSRDAQGKPLQEVFDLQASRADGLPPTRGAGSADPVEVTTVPIVGQGSSNLGFLFVMRPRAGAPEPGPARRPLNLDEYLQMELARLLRAGDRTDGFAEGQVEAYRRLMREFLGRGNADPAQLDWKDRVARRAVREAHEQTRGVLSARADFCRDGLVVPDRLAAYLDLLCGRVGFPGDPAPEVSVGSVTLSLDTAVYCVLLVEEALRARSGRSRHAVAVTLDSAAGVTTLAVSHDPVAGASPPLATPAMTALLAEIDGSLSIAASSRVTWTVTVPAGDDTDKENR